MGTPPFRSVGPVTRLKEASRKASSRMGPRPRKTEGAWAPATGEASRAEGGGRLRPRRRTEPVEVPTHSDGVSARPSASDPAVPFPEKGSGRGRSS